MIEKSDEETEVKNSKLRDTAPPTIIPKPAIQEIERPQKKESEVTKSLQKQARITKWCRLEVFSYLNNEEILKKASKLCSMDRDNLSGLIASSNRIFKIKIAKSIYVYKAMIACQGYFLSLISEIKIELPQMKPESIVQFLIGLPDKFDH